ncbi:MAG: glycosyltransferase family 2 protein [Verrucomicrobiales bacterium]|jgi:glycosyltransferase involved in cell wall biosynthesis|nr:glycosyltransferase family 2 protein [Verrucomicrobiales bacterium]
MPHKRRRPLTVMKFSVLINNHNYAAFVRAAVDGALAQSLPPHEIIVVDDGSTDDSLTVLRGHYADHQLVKIIAQKNGGQFAAIDAGIAAAAGDVVCLLDADDCYQPDYLASLSALYQEKPWIDLAFCRFAVEGRPEHIGKTRNAIWSAPDGDYDYGVTALLTYFCFKHHGTFMIGNVTSCLSLTLTLARRLRLGELGRQWATPIQADNALLLGASMLGARKYYFARELVRYRMHGGNHWAGRPKMSAAERRRNRAQHRVAFDFYKELSGLADADIQRLQSELSTVPLPVRAHADAYRRLGKIFSWRDGHLRERRGLWRRLKDLRWIFADTRR